MSVSRATQLDLFDATSPTIGFLSAPSIGVSDVQPGMELPPVQRFDDVTEPLTGFTDMSGREAQTHRFLSELLGQHFRDWGYEEVIVPIVERASSFSEEVIGGSPWPEWDKRGVFYLQLPGYDESYSDLPNQEPALLVPEGTISVSRWIAKSIDNSVLPRKIYYVMPCFRNELVSKLSPTKGRQFHQAGIEILGSEVVEADLEVLLIAHDGFVRSGVAADHMLVRIGSVSLFNKVCADTGLSDVDVLTVKDLMDTIAESRAGKEPERLEPSIARLKQIVDGYSPTPDVSAKWEALTRTHVSQLDEQFSEITGYPEEADDLNYLASVARSQHINCVIDPSVVRSHEYYTGIVYEIDVTIPGKPPLVEVAGGGRYNRLIGKFLDRSASDVVVPAVGFAYGMERVQRILELAMEGSLPGDAHRQVTSTFRLDGSSADIVLVPDNHFDGRLLAKAADLRASGHRVDLYVGSDYSDEYLDQYATQRGASLMKASQAQPE